MRDCYLNSAAPDVIPQRTFASPYNHTFFSAHCIARVQFTNRTTSSLIRPARKLFRSILIQRRWADEDVAPDGFLLRPSYQFVFITARAVTRIRCDRSSYGAEIVPDLFFLAFILPVQFYNASSHALSLGPRRHTPSYKSLTSMARGKGCVGNSWRMASFVQPCLNI